MPVNIQLYNDLRATLTNKDILLVAVSKLKPAEEIQELFDMGHRDFGENYVQELLTKFNQLPKEINWHFIGHLQSNKVKQIAPFVQLIHGVDSLSLLKEIDKQGKKNGRVIDCLLQLHIAVEETKFGLDENELKELLESSVTMTNVRIRGLMGMASLTAELDAVRQEFRDLATIFHREKEYFHQPALLSMGMSSDFRIAIEEGSNLVRIGSMIFGEREIK